MRLLIILISLLVIGLLIYQQVSDVGNKNSTRIPGNGDLETPRVPSTPGGVQSFGNEMQDFLNESARQRARQLDESTR